MAIEKGRSIGHYKIVSKIGSGGMGEVYAAEDTRLDRKAAIKFLHAQLARDEDKLSRFVREAKAASALNHPNILTVYDIGEVDGDHYIATELIEGRTLRSHLAARDEMPLNSILKIGVHVAEALSAAHTAGIVHRDIKPENIMIRSDGYTKVLDFGLAKLIEKEQTASSEDATRAQVNTMPGMVMGTAAYMSPEQARGNATDARTDVWSLGVVLYEMLAGKLPFSGETVNHTIVSILEKEPVLLENVPTELQRIVRKALSKDLDMRYQSTRDLLIDLKTLRRELDIQGELERSIVPDRATLASSSVDGETQFHHAAGERTASAGMAPTENVTSSSSLEYAVNQAKGHKAVAAIVGLVIVTLIGAGVYFAFVRGSGTRQISSIAVMPFENGSGNPEMEYLSDGMTESLISGLSQVPNLNVKGRSSVFRYKGKDTSAKIVGKELDVQAILSGRIIQRGDNLTLTLELIDAATENVLWGEQYDRRSTDLANLQSEIARDVSQKLKSRLSGADEQKIAKSYTANAEAYQLYLKGVYHWNKRNPEALKRAVEYFNQATEKDPGYGLAHAGIAQTYALFPDYFISTTQDAVPKAKAAAKRALEIDESLAEAHCALAYAHALDRQWADAEREYRRALHLNPNYATAHQWYYHLLMTQKRFDEAFAEIKRALELDPLSLIINANLADYFQYRGRYDDALRQSRATIEMDAGFYVAHFGAGIAHELKGEYDQALAEFRKGMELNNDPSNLSDIVYVNAVSGKRDEALKALDQMKQAANAGRYVSPYSFAAAYAGLGDKEKTLEYLERAYEVRDSYLQYVAMDRYFKNMHSEPRFVDLLRRTGIPE